MSEALRAQGSGIMICMNDVDIYLDVDGVLNAICPSEPDRWGWGKSRVVKVNGFPIRHSPNAVRRINQLAERPDVHMYWLTTWGHDAAELLSPKIGLHGRDWPVLLDAPLTRKMQDYSWWKFHAAREHFEASSHRAIWIDDDLAFELQAQVWAVPYVEAGRLLLVQPISERALTLDELNALEAWIDD